MNVGEILNGWGNYIKGQFMILPEEVRHESARRLSICDTCPVRSGRVCDPTKHEIHVKTKQQVRGCGCPIDVKSMSKDSQCPAGKW